MERSTMLAALATVLAASFAATAAPANAAVSSASISGGTATLNLDGANDDVTVSVAGGLLVHGQTTGGLNSGSDWDSGMPDDQTVAADGTFTLVVNGGDGNDSVTVLAKNTEVIAVNLVGDGGDDVLTGADSGDSLTGGDGNDRLVGAKGGDDVSGGAGNDTLVWNNGDSSDFIEGDAGNDATEVNGNPTLGDTFTIEPNAGRIKFRRTNLVSFILNASTERFHVNGVGGNDSLAASTGVGALTLLSLDGGAGVDTLDGSDGPDLILGGEGNDVLGGGGGDDRVVGDRGTDTINGGAGDDTLVWSNGDGSDVVNGDDGRDDVEVNGAPTAGDLFTVQSNGARIRLDRINLVPFSLDIGSSETLHANGLGGNDEVVVGTVDAFSVTAAGGADNDALVGGDSSETLLGGSGNDAISGGGGIDFVSGDDGDDQIHVRDGNADLARGGEGWDLVIADDGLDILDGFETVHAPPFMAPPPDPTPPPVVTPPPDVTPPPGGTPPSTDGSIRPVTISGGTLKVSRNTAAVRSSCPLASRGNCTGSLALRTAKPVDLAGRTRILQLGHARYNLAPGVSRTLKVKLAKITKRVADSKGHLKVMAVASTVTSGRSARTSQRLTLALGKPTKSR